MRNKHTHSARRRIVRLSAVAALSMAFSFMVGVRAANDYQAVDPTYADAAVLAGDYSGDGVLSQLDIERVLEILETNREPTEEELKADLGGDLTVTLDDAFSLVRMLEE